MKKKVSNILTILAQTVFLNNGFSTNSQIQYRQLLLGNSCMPRILFFLRSFSVLFRFLFHWLSVLSWVSVYMTGEKILMSRTTGFCLPARMVQQDWPESRNCSAESQKGSFTKGCAGNIRKIDMV